MAEDIKHNGHDLEEMKMVENEIGLARQMCAQMGNNDSEFDRLNEILENYKDGSISADEATSRAKLVPANKIER